MVEIGGGLRPCQSLLHAFWPDARCVSYDISQEAQDHNARLYPGAVWQLGDVTRGLDQPDESAEFVYSSHLIEHLEDPYQLIEEQLRICAVGGVAALAAPLYMYHREHRQVLTIDAVVGMLKDYYQPVICHVDSRQTEIVAAVVKNG